MTAPACERRRTRRYLAAFLVLLPFGVLYWLAPFAGSLTLGNDYGIFSIQQQLEIQYSLHHGTFPLYAPGFAGGRSAAALTVGQLYHPLPHIAARLPGYWQGQALEWSTFLRLIMLGVAQAGLFFLLRRARLSRATSFVLSFSAVYNLRMLDMFRYGAPLENYTGLLYLTTAMGWYWFRPRGAAGPALMLLSSFLLVCGGQPQIMYLGLIGAGVVALALPFTLGSARPGGSLVRPRLIRFYAGVGGSVAAGLLLSAAYLLGFANDIVADSLRRVDRPYAWSLGYSDSWGGTLNSFFAPLHADVHGAFGSSPVILFALFGPPLLAIGRAVSRRTAGVKTSTSKSGLLLWAFAVIVLLCGLGGLTPVHHLFWKYVPFASSFRVPGRIYLLLPPLFLIILAGLARDLERARSSPTPGSPLRSSGALLFVVVVSLFVLHRFVLIDLIPPPGKYHPAAINGMEPRIETAVFWLGLASLFLVAVYCAPGRGRRQLTALCGVLLATAIVLQSAVELRFGSWVEAKPRVWTLEQMDRQKQQDLAFAGYPTFGMESAGVTRQMRESVLEWQLAKFFSKVAFAASPNLAYDYLATRGRADTLVVESDGAATPPPPAAVDPVEADRVGLLYGTFNCLRFSVAAGRQGHLLLAYPFSPGWRARVDGRPAPIVRGNGYAIAVPVPAGNHQVEFTFASDATTTGMRVSLATLAVLLLLLAFRRSGPRRWTGATLAVALPCGLYLIWQSSLYQGDNLGTRYAWSSVDLPSADNLAYGKRARMSSIYSDLRPTKFYAGLGVDGRRTEMPFRTAAADPSPWWEVDLGLEAPVAEIRIFGAAGNEPHLPLLVAVSVDGRTYRVVQSAGTPPAGGEPWRIPLAGVRARHVRLHSSGRGSLALTEVEIYAAGTKDVPPPAAGLQSN